MKVERHVVILQDKSTYRAFPSLTVLPNGKWPWAFDRTARKEHVIHPPQDSGYRPPRA
jgi:hypothetical protein